MMKTTTKLLASTALALTLIAGAADRSYAADWDKPVAGYDWSGLYIGAHVGAMSADMGADTIGLGPIPGGLNPDPSGILGGILGGYNYQMDSFVFGIEGDVSFANVNDTDAFPGVPIRGEIDNTYSIRGRLGYAVDRTLLFVTAGAAWADAEATFTTAAISDSNTHFGFQIGGGIEHAFTDSIIFRAEYLYANYGEEGYDIVGGGGAVEDDYDLETHTARVAVIWKFGNLFGW